MNRKWRLRLGWRWYSICSAHLIRYPKCDLCNRGVWVFEPWAKLSRIGFGLAPGLWRRIANWRAPVSAPGGPTDTLPVERTDDMRGYDGD